MLPVMLSVLMNNDALTSASCSMSETALHVPELLLSVHRRDVCR